MAKTTEFVCCNFTIRVLQAFGLFQLSGKTEKSKILWKGLFLLILSAVPLTGSILHFTMNVKEHLYYHLDFDLAIMLSMTATYIFTVYFVFNSKTAVKLYLILSDFEKFGKPINFEERLSILEKCARAHYYYIETLVSTLIAFSNILKAESCRQENLELNLHEVCGLFAYTWLPFDIDYFPVKYIYLFLQMFGTHYLYVVAGTISWMLSETIEHIIVRVQHAKHLFLEAIEEKDRRRQREMFDRAVEYHIAVLSLEDLLNQTFGVFAFAHLAMTAPIMGTAFFVILNGGSPSSLFISLGWLFGVTKDCFCGQRLQNESLEISTCIYQSDWYNCQTNIQKDIAMVIMRSRKPMRSKAASFGEMGLEMLLEVLKAAYSYMALLAQTQ